MDEGSHNEIKEASNILDHENKPDMEENALLPDQTNFNFENKQTNEPFKKPLLLVGPQRGKKGQSKFSKVIREQDKSATDGTTNAAQSNDDPPSTSASGNAPDEKTGPKETKPTPPIPYQKPEWGGLPENEYKLEELKNGTILKTVDLTAQSFFVFGRLENCDIAMLHPTVSRYHAVLQYRSAGEDDNEPGFYIYDLESSLGTFVNKQKIIPKTYIRVKVGYIIKIGCSSRMFILQGPPEDEEPESELTVTELKQQYKDKLAALEAEKARKEVEEEERLRKENERGIDWGMGEDADEETDLSENPYAATLNEELYLDDPKKTLRGWFEREGEELEYDVEEKGFGHFVCRIELPVDNGGGGYMVAEASVKGKKKEAVVQAALEACRLLDRQGLLRQSNHESKKKAAKDWEANDFYDSDEDNFLDRTGQIEKKRQQRMAQSGKVEPVVETYDTLMEKYAAIMKELERTENKLNDMLSVAAAQSRRPGQEQWEDDLDAYMDTLRKQPADKLELKKMKDQVAKLRAEEGRMRNLVNVARPTELPKLEPATIHKGKKTEPPHVMIGKKPIKKRPHQRTEVTLPLQTTQQHPENESKEEFDEEEEEEETMEIGCKEEADDGPKAETVAKKKRSRPDTRFRHSKQKTVLKEEEVEDYSNCRWKPPEGQTGDGRTSLNDKYGY